MFLNDIRATAMITMNEAAFLALPNTVSTSGEDAMLNSSQTARVPTTSGGPSVTAGGQGEALAGVERADHDDASSSTAARRNRLEIHDAAVAPPSQVLSRTRLEASGEAKKSFPSRLAGSVAGTGNGTLAESAEQWAQSVVRSGSPVSVTQKAIYDEERNPAPFCLYWLDDLYRVNKFVRSRVVEYMGMNDPSRYADIRQWHEWLHAADTDPSLSEEDRRQLVRNAFALMYRNGAPPDTIGQAARYVRTCAQDLAFLSARHGNAGWFAYDRLVKSIRDIDPDQRSLFLRCVTLHMIQNREIDHLVRADASGNATEMIRPVLKQSLGFEQSLVLREMVIKSLSAAVILSPEYIQTLRDLGSAQRPSIVRVNEQAYLDGLEKLALDAPTLSEKQVHKISNDLTDTYLALVPREERNAEKKWLRERVAFETVYSGTPGNWFDMRMLCSDLYHAIRTHNADPVFTMAILKRELGKGTIQAQTGIFFTADSQTLTVHLRSYKHRHTGESACTLL